MLECQNIHYAVGKKSILEDVSLSVRPGEIVALCGPNGAGKSTLLRVASGEVRADRGTVSIGRRPLSDWTPRNLAKVRAKLSQESHLSFSFRVREVVEMGRFPHDSAASSDDIVDACMERVGIRELACRDYTTLSGGEKQRVHMARVLAQLSSGTSDSKLLLLDEPTSALDLHHQELALAMAHDLCGEHNYGVLVVLHDLNLAAAWADRLILLRDGKIYNEGTPESVLTEPILRAVYAVDAIVLPHPSTGRPVVTIDRKRR